MAGKMWGLRLGRSESWSGAGGETGATNLSAGTLNNFPVAAINSGGIRKQASRASYGCGGMVIEWAV